MHRGIRRRTLLRGATAGVTAVAAGCLGGGSPDCSAALPTPIRGDPDAAVTVAAYEDYACPHCQTYVLDHLPTILEEYADPGRIRYEHHDFPLPVSDPASWEAANAARAVQDEAGTDAFWSYNTRLYEEQDSLGLDLYVSVAGEVDVDPDTVRAAAENRTYATTIECDKQRGTDRGVQGTPTVVVDGDAVASYRASAVSDAIDTALELSGNP